MHEAAVAQKLLQLILAETEKHGGRPVAARVSYGPLEAINKEALCFAFEAISGHTACSSVKLHVEQKPLLANCGQCKHSFEIDLKSQAAAVCPQCGSADFEVLADAPLMLERIEFEIGGKDERN